MDINLNCPINQLGYGIVGTNIFLNLIKKHNVSLWPLGPVDCIKPNIDKIKESIEKTNFFNYTAPSLKIWHQFDMANHPGNGTKNGLTFS